MKRANEKGMAMILTLIMLAVLAAMAVSFMFLSQAETWTTMNYRFMNQARDGAEAGVNVAANHLLYSYTAPTAGSATDPLSAYNMTTRPVSAGGNRVVLSAHDDVTSTYPAAGVSAAFAAAARGSLASGSAMVNYQTTATLLAMRQVTPYGNTCPNGTPAPCTVQTWLIAGDGRIAGIRNAQVQVESVLERPVTPTFGNAAFGTSEVCNPEGLDFSGGGTTNSYDSTTFIPGVTPFDNYGGNVGTNGNLTLGGSGTIINGNLSTPRTGVGSCASGAAETISGGASLNGSVIGLPQRITYPPPAAPIPNPPNNNVGISNNGDCVGPPGPGLPGCALNIPIDYRLTPTCASAGGNCTAGANPTYGNLSIGAGRIVHLNAGTYIMNSISLQGNSAIVIDSGPVILNVAGQGIGPNQYVIDFNGGSITNASLNPLNFQILYAGTSDIRLRGGAASAATVYAPNADITLGGGGDFYGSLIGYSVEVSGGTALHYDRNLANTAYFIGNFVLSSFTWRKF